MNTTTTMTQEQVNARRLEKLERLEDWQRDAVQVLRAVIAWNATVDSWEAIEQQAKEVLSIVNEPRA